MIYSRGIGENEGAKEYAKILKKREELLKRWEKNVSFVFVKPAKKKRSKLVVRVFYTRIIDRHFAAKRIYVSM